MGSSSCFQTESSAECFPDFTVTLLTIRRSEISDHHPNESRLTLPPYIGFSLPQSRTWESVHAPNAMLSLSTFRIWERLQIMKVVQKGGGPLESCASRLKEHVIPCSKGTKYLVPEWRRG
jgi:hypothetical protein